MKMALKLLERKVNGLIDLPPYRRQHRNEADERCF